MGRRLRTALTLVVLLAVVAGGAAWGWSRLTSPAAEEASGPCTDTEVSAGDRLRVNQVLVTVLNAGNRSGLASRTMNDLTDRGFAQGQESNAPEGTRVPRVQIWTEEPRSPAVRLVRSHLGEAPVIRRDDLGEGVNVVVGDGFEELVAGRRAVEVTDDTTLCLAGG